MYQKILIHQTITNKELKMASAVSLSVAPHENLSATSVENVL